MQRNVHHLSHSETRALGVTAEDTILLPFFFNVARNVVVCDKYFCNLSRNFFGIVTLNVLGKIDSEENTSCRYHYYDFDYWF